MNILLVNPSQYDRAGVLQKFSRGSIPPLNLMILAAIAREYPDVRVEVADEFTGPVPFGQDWDLVGITTTFSCTWPRAREISRLFREKGIPVVMGGNHVSCNYDECSADADSIVIGEGENSFRRLLDDLSSGRKPAEVYRDDDLYDMGNSGHVMPAYDLIDLDRYIKIGLFKKTSYLPLENSRGCPMNCNFCNVRITHGTRPRFKKLEHVVEELRFVRDRYQARNFTFTDDNFIHDVDRTKELLKTIAGENIHFHCELTTRILRKQELMPYLKKAGCVSALIGFESVNQDSLGDAKKGHNRVEDYLEIFRLFEKYKIPVMPAFMFGFDHDTSEEFDKVMDLLRKTRVQRAVFSILTPLPGTGFYRQMREEDRIIEDNLSLYDGGNVVFNPVHFTPEQLMDEYWAFYQRYYRTGEILRRIIKGKKSIFIFNLATNLTFRKLVNRRLHLFSSGIRKIRNPEGELEKVGA